MPSRCSNVAGYRHSFTAGRDLGDQVCAQTLRNMPKAFRRHRLTFWAAINKPGVFGGALCPWRRQKIKELPRKLR